MRAGELGHGKVEFDSKFMHAGDGEMKTADVDESLEEKGWDSEACTYLREECENFAM